jgi:MoxR-like ATPase
MQKLTDIANHLSRCFVERLEIIHGLLTALVARQHVLLIGLPGTAKSAIVVELTRCISGASYFQWLLSRFSTPEELFGPVSIKALEQGVYQRNTFGKLPEAHIGFIDEIFKANSAILNSLLTLINERLFYNNGHPVKTPLMSVFGASNEYPEEDENLSALYDRFLLRYEVGPISEDAAFAAMLTGQPPAQRPQITLEELERIQASARMVQVTPDIIDTLVQLRRELAAENIRPTDRRWKQSLTLIQARATLSGRIMADISDVEILKDCLWDEPGQKETVAGLVRKYCVDQVTAEVEQILGEVEEIRKNATKNNSDDVAVEIVKKMKSIISYLEELSKKHPSKAVYINNSLEKVRNINKEILHACLGIL